MSEQQAKISEALTARVIDMYGNGLVTGWVTVVEFCDSNGDLIAVTLHDDVSPPWKLEGLLTAVSDFYGSEDSDEEDE